MEQGESIVTKKEEKMLIKELMTKNVITVKPETTLKEVAHIFKEHRINGVPVLDNDGYLGGIITMTDLLRMLRDIHYWGQMGKKVPEIGDMKGHLVKEKEEATVSSKMAKNVMSLKEENTLDDVIDIMCKFGIHTIPIVKDGKLVGVMGATDVVNACFSSDTHL